MTLPISISSSSSFLLSLALPLLHFSCSTSFTISSSFGRNSCNGMSISLIVMGFPFAISNISLKSSFCRGFIMLRYFFLSSVLPARIIFLTSSSLSCELNIRSVLARPMPSAPFSIAFFTISGVSALALMPSFLYLSAMPSTFDML